MQKEYSESIESLRQERQLQRNFISEMTEEVDSMLNTFAIDEGELLVSEKTLADLELNVNFPVNKKVYFTKHFQNDDVIKFKCFMSAGASFGMQFHDVLECCEVIEGHLIEVMRGNKIYIKGQKIYYASKELHKPICRIKSVYDVTFYRNKE